MNNTLRRACTGVYVGNISEKVFTLCVNTTVSPYGSLIHKKWFSELISMSWFDSQLQHLRYCHWKLKKSRLTVSLTNLLAGYQLVSNVTCCLHSEVRLLFLLHFWTDIAGLRKNVPCLFSNKPKLTKLRISKVLLALSTKTLTKFSKLERQIFRLATESGCFYSTTLCNQHNTNLTQNTQPHTTTNHNKVAGCRATSVMASTAAHSPPASAPAQFASSPHHGQCRVCLVL